MMKKIKVALVLLLSCSLGGMLNGMEEEKTMLPTYDQQAAGKEAFPPMSQDELLQWKEAVDSEVMKFVDSLPEDEQAQFWKDVEEMEQVMKNMSEDELTQFLEDIFVPVEAVAQPELIKEEAPVQAVPEEKKETKPVVEEKVEDINKAIKMLSNIITRTERFLRKLDRIPDISGKIEEWISKDKIKEWNVDLTWSKLIHDIDLLDGRLHKVKESLDPKTKQHRHVSDMIKNEVLYNNLNKLSSTLTKYEPLVEPAQLSTTKGGGTQKIGKEVKDAIREILGAFAEAIFTLEVSKELEIIIEKYEPRAKEHREEEEKAEKRAHEEAKKPRTPSPKKEAAAPKGPKGYTPTGGGEFYEPYYGGYTPPYEGMYEYPSYPYEQQPIYEEMGGAAGGKQAAGGKGGRARAEAHEAGEEKTGEEKGGKEVGKKPEGKQEEKFVESAEAKHNLRSLEKAADNIEQALENKAFKNIAAFMAPAPAMLVDKDLVEDIAMVTRNINKAIDAIKAFKLAMKTFNAPQKERYGKEFKTILGAFKSPLKKLAEQVEPVILGKAGYSADKRYAYFNDENVKKDALALDPDLPNKVKKAANFEVLGKALVDFSNATYEPKKK